MMNRYNRREKDKITQFRQITGASDKIAVDCLKASGWSVEVGIETFYSSGLASQSAPPVNPAKLEALFATYKDPDSDYILADGIGRLCDDLGVDPADIVMLVLSWHLGAATMCEYSHDEFVQGLNRLSVDSIDGLKRRLPDLRAELREPSKWHDIYNYAFNFSREKGQKCLQLDTAIAMWQLLFADERRWPYVEEWCSYLQAHHNRAISKDTWGQLLEFVRQIRADFSNYDENGAWPYVLDCFVEHMKEKSASAAANGSG